MRDYPALTLTWTRAVDAERVDLLLADLSEFGPTAVEELPDQALRAYFASDHDRTRAASHFTSSVDLIVTADDVSDQDWAARSQHAIGAITAGAITVAPPWAVPADPRTERLIIIQPSMGFGTGHHASTRLCLTHLQSLTVPGARVLDVGTGSGVLAIAAAQLGAATVVAIDLDPDALENAQENLALNGGPAAVSFREMTLARAVSLDRQFDIILANLTGGHLIREAAHFAPLAAPGARLIVSGFQTDESDDVVGAIEIAGWKAERTATEETWVAAVLTLPAPRRP